MSTPESGPPRAERERRWPPDLTKEQVAGKIVDITEDIAREVADLRLLQGLTVEHRAALAELENSVRTKLFHELCDFLGIDRHTQDHVADPYMDEDNQ